MANIVIINPRFEPSFWGGEHFIGLWTKQAAVVPTAALPLLAALTPAPHEVTLIDENVEDIDFDLCARADIVGVTGMIVQRFRARQILETLKNRGAFTVVGGAWVTVQEDYFGALADVIFVGEAEDSWPQFLAEWSEGRHAKRYEQAERTDMSKVPVPRHDLLKKRYSAGSIQFSRGCPFTCEFCDIIVTFGRRPRLKTEAQIIQELESMRRNGYSYSFIVDDNLIGNKKAIKEILRAVIRWQRDNDYPMTFCTEASVDLADDDEMMALMVEANIDSVFVGIETPNEDSLRETRKLQNVRKGKSLVEKVHAIQAAGMEVWSGMIVGFDNDKADIFDRQVRFIEEARIVRTMVGMLYAIPKTPLYERLRKEQRLDLADPPQYGTNVIPFNMDRQQLMDGFLRVMRELYHPKAYFARLDNLYLNARLTPRSYARRHLREQQPWWLRLRMFVHQWMYTTIFFVRLHSKIKDEALRRHYRGAMLRVLVRRPDPVILGIYVTQAGQHYHFHTLISSMVDSATPVNSF